MTYFSFLTLILSLELAATCESLAHLTIETYSEEIEP